MKRLQDNLNSQFIALANRLRPRNAKRKIIAYVESYDDVFFWRSVLQDFETEMYRFEVMLPSRNNLAKGKKSALMNHLGNSLGGCMIACVDADYDWLMQGQTEISKVILQNPYVFHTYAYAIENLQCYAPSLHIACVMSTLNDRTVIDFEAFMQEYSRIIWPLFVWNVWAYRYGRYKEFSMSQFDEIVGFHEINPSHPENAIEALRRRVNRTIAQLQGKFPEGRKTYQPLKEELMTLGLTPDTTYLYIQGHTLFENVVMPLLTPVCNMLRREREREINTLAMHNRQKQNELSGYQHSQSPIDVMIRKVNDFKDSLPYQLLKEDMIRFMAEVGREK